MTFEIFKQKNNNYKKFIFLGKCHTNSVMLRYRILKQVEEKCVIITIDVWPSLQDSLKCINIIQITLMTSQHLQMYHLNAVRYRITFFGFLTESQPFSDINQSHLLASDLGSHNNYLFYFYGYISLWFILLFIISDSLFKAVHFRSGNPQSNSMNNAIPVANLRFYGNWTI